MMAVDRGKPPYIHKVFTLEEVTKREGVRKILHWICLVSKPDLGCQHSSATLPQKLIKETLLNAFE
jgi:hypothetical protein